MDILSQYLSICSVSHSVHCRVIGLESMRKTWSWRNLRYIYGLYLAGLSKATGKLGKKKKISFATENRTRNFSNRSQRRSASTVVCTRDISDCQVLFMLLRTCFWWHQLCTLRELLNQSWCRNNDRHSYHVITVCLWLLIYLANYIRFNSVKPNQTNPAV